jgi:citronellol/citronellal dehydrogenase
MGDAASLGDDARPLGLDDAAFAAMPTVYAPGLFAGQVALVSGGAGGIGRAISWLLARLGAHVVVAGRKREKIDGIVEALGKANYSASGVIVDIRDADAVAEAFAGVKAAHGNLNQLVNCAGGQFPQAAIDFSVKGWNAVVSTNLSGTWFMMQAAARLWREAATGGSIVNIVVVTRHGLYGVAHSVAARAGVIALSESVAVEWAPLNIRVNCVAPGAIETEGWRAYSPEARSQYWRSNPMMRVGSAWDVAEACVYLGSPAGGYITGDLLTVAGGGHLWGETWTTGRPDYFGS